MPLVLSDIRRPTFTTCGCVTSQIAKSFLFDRRSHLLSFRLVARPPPTQDPVHLTISRGFWLLLRSAKCGFHCSTQISSGRSQRQLHCSFCQSTPFSRISALYTQTLTRWAVFLPPQLFLLHFTISLPGSQRKFVALPICLKPPHMNPFQPVSNWWGMNTEVIPVALLSWDICNHLPNIMRGLGPSTFSSPNSHCQDQILHLLKHKRETVRERDETEFQEADSLCSSSMVNKPSK